MPRRRNAAMMDELAVGRASGLTVATWARRHNIPPGTASGWTRTEGFGERVRAHRAILVARELELLAEHSVRTTTAADPVPTHPSGPDSLRAD